MCMRENLSAALPSLSTNDESLFASPIVIIHGTLLTESMQHAILRVVLHTRWRELGNGHVIDFWPA